MRYNETTMKSLTLAALLAVCGPAFAAEEKPVPKPAISAEDTALARKNGVHEAILKLAKERKIPESELPAFYSAQAKAASQWFDQYMKTAESAAQNTGSAIQEWTAKTSSSPADADAWFFRAVTEERMGDLRAAEESYGKSLAADPKGRWGMAYYLRALVRKDLEDPSGAASDLDAAIDIAPGNPYFHYARASLGVEQGNYTDAARDMHSFFSVCEDSAAAQTVAQSMECEELAAMGFNITGCAQATGEGARKAAAPEIGFAPWEYSSQSEKNEIALYLYDAVGLAVNIAGSGGGAARAGTLAKTGDTALLSLSDSKTSLKAALKLYGLSLFVEPTAKAYLKHGAALLELARLYQHDDSLKLAEEDFDRALKLDPKGAGGWAFMLRARAHAAAGRYDAAEADADRATAADGENGCFFREKAAVLAAKKEYKKAAEAMAQFMKLAAKSKQTGEADELCNTLAANGAPAEGCFAPRPPAAQEENPLPPCSLPLEPIGEQNY